MILKTSSLKPKRKRKNLKNSSEEKELGGRKAPIFKLGQRVTVSLPGHKPYPAIIVKPFSPTQLPHLKHLKVPGRYSITVTDYITPIGKKTK
tara:strand:- start:234 stop:509 length:276 start_codon:yes stop_codon:yes gene_type:complete